MPPISFKRAKEEPVLDSTKPDSADSSAPDEPANERY